MSEHEVKFKSYERYELEGEKAPDRVHWPSRFKVSVRRRGLAKLLFKEIFEYGPRNKDVILSRPCVYGVFSGPVGGFMPREHLCVGCLRCTTEFPEFVSISHNPERQCLGDSYFNFHHVNAVSYEAQAGMVPVKGAGYRGKFGGEGWDGMWTDMSEIVRPTRDGIHGREFISTAVDVGYKPNYLTFDGNGQPSGELPDTISLPVPMMFDALESLGSASAFWRISAAAAERAQTLAVVPLDAIIENGLAGNHIVPLVREGDEDKWHALGFEPEMVEMDGWNAGLFEALRKSFPDCQIVLRTGFAGKELLEYADGGVRVFHLTADHHGRGAGGEFVLDLIRKAHNVFVDAGRREEVTLIGSGGMVAAEHLPKAIICGLDVVGIDTPLLVALQAEMEGECADRTESEFTLPQKLDVEWGAQRLFNLAASWRDQLLEIMGAMGLREVRRMRGEMGRAMFMVDLEAVAFAEVEGYPHA
ncbi:MAG: glutamate synthase-related protein [Anaerolineae bacterium]|nr:glutamate synthase-related protein [Anaerolineae bacterium]